MSYDRITYNYAIELVNQLADKFYFEMIECDKFEKHDAEYFDIVHDLTNKLDGRNIVHFYHPAYSPYKYFPLKYRQSEIPQITVLDNLELSKVLNFPNIDTDALRRDLNTELNKFDICICESLENAIIASAAGCSVIVTEKYKFYLPNAYESRGEDSISDCVKYITTHFEQIKSNMMKIVREVENTYSWFYVKTKYEHFYEKL